MKARFLFAVSVSLMLAAGALSASAANRPTKPMPRMEKDFRAVRPAAPVCGHAELHRNHCGAHRHSYCKDCKYCRHCAKYHRVRPRHAVPPPPPPAPRRLPYRYH